MVAGEKEIYLAVLIVVAFLAIILAFFLLNLLYNQRKIRALQKSLIMAEVQALEKERKRVSADIHDEIAPSLIMTSKLIDSLELPEEDREVRMLVQEALEGAIEKIRFISQNITPRHIQDKGLIITINSLINSFQAAVADNVEFMFETDGIEPDISEEALVNIYRIIQEAINNSLKHSGATKIHISITTRSRLLVIAVSDNGSGFSYSLNELYNSKQDVGIGLRNLQNRAILLGGELKILTYKNKGTQIIAEIPV